MRQASYLFSKAAHKLYKSRSEFEYVMYGDCLNLAI